MEQEYIRPFDGETYSVEEGSRMIQELDKRTRSSKQGYNSMDELAQKVEEYSENQNEAINDAVRFTPQNKTNLEKEIAITNIGAQKKVTTDPSLYINQDGVIMANVSPQEEVFTYSGGNQIFTLQNTAVIVDSVKVNREDLYRFNEFLMPELNQIEITNYALSIGDKVKINYKSFIN